MSCSKVGGALGTKASIRMITPAEIVLFPGGLKKFFSRRKGIIHRRWEYSTANGHHALSPQAIHSKIILHERSYHPRQKHRRHRPPGIPQMHGLGRHRRSLDPE